MTAIDDALRANQDYAAGFKMGHLPAPPKKQLTVVTCMDARMLIDRMLGLDIGDAQVIRNAGGVVTEDVLRSLIVSHYMLFTREFMIINHTDCGLLRFRDEEMLQRLQRTTGTATVAPSHFHTFTNIEENVRMQVQKVRSHPWIPNHIVVRGFVYDVNSGRLSEVIV